MDPTLTLDDYDLGDRYTRDEGRVFLTGTQALVRLPMVQRALDNHNGLDTAGFISGYRGSPLGGVVAGPSFYGRTQYRFYARYQ